MKSSDQIIDHINSCFGNENKRKNKKIHKSINFKELISCSLDPCEYNFPSLRAFFSRKKS